MSKYLFRVDGAKELAKLAATTSTLAGGNADCNYNNSLMNSITSVSALGATADRHTSFAGGAPLTPRGEPETATELLGTPPARKQIQ